MHTYTVVYKKCATFIFWITPCSIGWFWQFLSHSIMNTLDVNVFNLTHLTLMLSLHYFVKCRSRSLAVNNYEFVLGVHTSAQKITEATKSLKNCFIYLTLVVFFFKIVRWRTEMTHQQQVSRFRSCHIARAVGERHQCHCLHSCWRGHFKHVL